MKISKDTLLEESVSPQTVFMQFVVSIKKNPTNSVFCFVEGDDMCYYISWIKGLREDIPIPIDCEGKKNVIGAYNLIKSKSEYDKYAKLFFVDADFDDNSTISDEIYVTPCYSIENLYVSKSAINQLLTIEYKLKEKNNDKLNKAISLYESNLAIFLESILLFNAWYACVNKRKKACVKLGDKFPSKFLKLHINDIQSTYTIDDIENFYPEAPQIPKEELEAQIGNLKKTDLRRSLRGKYMVQFLCEYLKFLNEDSHTSKIYTVVDSKININNKLLLSNFSQYADFPPSLRDYIKNGVRSITK